MFLRVLVHDFCGHPFQVDLSREFARRGHIVEHLHCSSLCTPKGHLDEDQKQKGELVVQGLDLGESFQKYSLAKRFRHELRYGDLLVEAAKEFRPEVMISANAPLFSQAKLLGWSRRNEVPFIFWLQDVQSVAMRAKGSKRLGMLGRLVSALVELLERTLLQRSDAVVVISEDFETILAEWQISRPIVTIHNWAPISELPMAPKANRWSLGLGLSDKPVFLYSGTLGLKHKPDLLWQLAVRLSELDPNARLVVISEGSGMEWLAGKVQESPLPSLVLLPFQSYDDYPNVLAAADVLVGILEPSAGIFSVPSKIMSYHCAGRPILAAIPQTNLAARILTNNRTGFAVDPANPNLFIEAAEKLLIDEQLRKEFGMNARRFAEMNFKTKAIADRFDMLIGVVLEASSGVESREGVTQGGTGG